MGKRILILGLIALLLAAGVSAWLVLGPLGQDKGGGDSARDSGSPVSGVSGGTPESTAHRHDADANSVQPGSREGAGSDRRESPGPSGTQTQPGQSRGTSPGKSSAESAGKPAHSKEPPAPSVPAPTPQPRTKIIDAPRPPNQTLGNARPVSRAIKTPPAKKLEDVSEKLKQDRRGLYAQYYAFQSEPLAELAKEDAKPLAQREANLVRIDNQVHFPNNEAFADLPFDLANFAAAWDGYLVIPEQGEYWLFLGADNAARVDLDGETVLLNDVQSRYIEVSTVLELAPGLHPLHIEFAQGMLANEDSWRCAASFMWVPKGQQKPVPVPPEMLMVPDWMWSDDAPIITKLSKYEGEIGDEITIEGQGFAFNAASESPSPKDSWEQTLSRPIARFNGQPATLLAFSSKELRVRVPIGASTGKVNVERRLMAHAGSNQPSTGFSTEWVPSNSIDFKVTTQFGLLACWYKINEHAGASIPDFSELTPESARFECNIAFEDRDQLDLSCRNEPLACRWEGFVGLPASQLVREVWVHSSASTLRLKVGDQTVESEEARPVDWKSSLVIRIDPGDERRLPIVIEWVNPWGPKGNCSFGFTLSLIAKEDVGKPTASSWQSLVKYERFLFPPVTPPKPPRIASVIPMTIAGDEPPTPPFAATPGLVSVREGQQFRVNLEISGEEEVQIEPVSLFIDGHILECDEGASEDRTLGSVRRSYVAVLPPGCGEGKLIAKLGLSTSEPFYIDVANKGLIAYLYDLPNPSGYSQFPNILPLTCHTIRKEREINFGTADSFNLPFVAETFAIEWYGAIIIEQDGWYTFTSRTDDGCRVWLNGIEIIDDDNLHAPQEKSSERMRLVAGTYPFRMQFFECNQHEECLLFVSAVDLQEKELLAKQVVPKRMFTWEVHDTLPDKVATGRKADGTE